EGMRSWDEHAVLTGFIGSYPNSRLATGEEKGRRESLEREVKAREQEVEAAEAKKRQVEREAAQEWEKIKSSTDQTALSTFQNRYPDTAGLNHARQPLAELDRHSKKRLERQHKKTEAAPRECDRLRS